LIDLWQDQAVQLAEHVDPALVRDFDYHGGAAFLVDPFRALDRARGDRTFFSVSYGGYWVLTRFADIREAFQRPDLFSSAQFSIPAGAYPRTMRPLALDPPDHTPGPDDRVRLHARAAAE
jgi:cytochrome P450